MQELATIEKVLPNNYYQVSLQKQGGCSACSGCSFATSSKPVTIHSTKNYQVGQQIVIEINKASICQLIFRSYLWPLILFIGTTLVTDLFFPEGVAVLFGLLAMTVGLIKFPKIKNNYSVKD